MHKRVHVTDVTITIRLKLDTGVCPCKYEDNNNDLYVI